MVRPEAVRAAASGERTQAARRTGSGRPSWSTPSSPTARNGDFDRLLALLDPDVVLGADQTAAQMGAAQEIHGAVEVAEFSRRARGAKPALLNGTAAAVWMPGGQPRVVYNFTISGEKITAIHLIADPACLRQFDPVIPSG